MHNIAFLDRATVAPDDRRRHLRRGRARAAGGRQHDHAARGPARLHPDAAGARASFEAQQALADKLIDNLERFAQGTPVIVVQGAF